MLTVLLTVFSALDPVALVWTPLPPMPCGRSGFALMLTQVPLQAAAAQVSQTVRGTPL